MERGSSSKRPPRTSPIAETIGARRIEIEDKSGEAEAPPSLHLPVPSPSASAPSSRASLVPRGAAHSPTKQQGPSSSRALDAGPASLRPPVAVPKQIQLVSRSACETVAIAGDCLILILERKLTNIGVNAIRRALELLESEHEEIGY